jgi:hypothetical protein
LGPATRGGGNAVVSVAQQGGAAVGGAVAGLFGDIRNAAEHAVLEQAKRIQTVQATRKGPEKPGQDLELSSPGRR